MKANEGFCRKNWSILILFGLIGQIAWSVENMYFNLFVFEKISPNLDAITLMVQLSGITATVVTLVAGTLSDKLGNRRTFLSLGYTIWGVTVGLFGLISPEKFSEIFNMPLTKAVGVCLFLVIFGDCIMTLFGSSANDAAFNAWVTDNTEPSYRGTVEGVVSILPLVAMLIVAGGFGIIKDIVGYPALFIGLGVVITASGIYGLFSVKDSPALKKSGSMKDLFYGFKPRVIKGNASLYVTLLIILVYGIACQIFMPYLIIYMTTFLSFSVIEYSLVFGGAIVIGALVNLYLTRLSDRLDKTTLMFYAAGVFALGLFGMYLSRFTNDAGKTPTIIVFGIFGCVMIVGYIFISALAGSMVRDYTPEGEVGKLQGVRMVFSVLIPMVVGPMIGNALNKTMGQTLPNLDSADVMTTHYIPAPEIFLVAGICALLLFAIVPILKKVRK